MPTQKDPFGEGRFRVGTGTPVEGFLERADPEKLRKVMETMESMTRMIEAAAVSQVSGTIDKVKDLMNAPFGNALDVMGDQLEAAFNPLVVGVLQPLLQSGLLDTVSAILSQINVILVPALQGIFNILNLGLQGIAGGISNIGGGGLPAAGAIATTVGLGISGALTGGIIAGGVTFGPIGAIVGGIIGGLAGLFIGGLF